MGVSVRAGDGLILTRADLDGAVLDPVLEGCVTVELRVDEPSRVTVDDAVIERKLLDVSCEAVLDDDGLIVNDDVTDLVTNDEAV